MGNRACFIMLQCLEMNVDNRNIHSGINILWAHPFFFSFFASFILTFLSLTGSKVLCPWLRLMLNRFMRTFVSYFLFSWIVKTDCRCGADWVDHHTGLVFHCQPAHIHFWRIKKSNRPMAFCVSAGCGADDEVKATEIIHPVSYFDYIFSVSARIRRWGKCLLQGHDSEDFLTFVDHFCNGWAADLQGLGFSLDLSWLGG